MSTRSDLPDDGLDLPWFVTERLDPDDAMRIETALAHDPELVRQLDIARNERDETVATNERLGAPSPAARNALFARIDADAARKRSPWGLLARVSRLMSGFSAPLLATAAVALVIIVVQGALLSSVLRDHGDATHYVTASAPNAPASSGEVLLVGFAPTATAGEIIALLHDAHATVVSGPRPGNLFEIKLADQRLPAADLQGAIKRLREQKSLVQFVASESGAP